MSREQERIKKKLEKNPIIECNKIQKKFCPELFFMFGNVEPYKKDEVYILRLSNEQYKKLCENKENKSEKEREKERIKSWLFTHVYTK